MRDRVSVCIATFNGEKYIVEQLLSILGQIRTNDEIIISDDHSTDNTLQFISDLKDQRIRVFTNNGKRSPVYNMENALSKANGDIIFLADQDDIWYPEKVSVMMPLLETCDLVVSDATVIDQSGKMLHPSFFKANRSERGFIRNWYRNSFMGCCMAFNRKLLTYVMPFPKGIAMHDLWIGLNAALAGKYTLLNQPLVYYRRHDMNATPGAERSGFTVSYMIKYRVYMMCQVILRRLERSFV